MKIEINYNSYTYKFDIKTDDESYNNENNGQQCKRIINENAQKKRIDTWFERFLIKFGEDFNRPNLEITFISTQYECNNVKEVISKIREGKNWNITFKPKIVKDKDVLGELNKLIKTMVEYKESTLYKQFEKDYVLSKVEDIDKREVSVVVTAPMSAGKSTLINALIGKDLLPSKNMACTATICKIKDVYSKVGFDAVIKNGEGIIIDQKKDIDSSFLENYNSKGNSEDIEIFIEGNIKNIDSSDLKLVLVDTPGPNFSRNLHHKEVTFNYIKDKNNNPLILYVLNATQLETNDDTSVLKEISDFIKANGSNTRERIIFILNKIDALDPETETLEKIIGECKDYLADNFDIESPKIFPISAQFAQLTLKNEITLRRNEKSDLKNLKNKILPEESENYKGIDTIQFAPISQKQKDILYQEAKDNEYKASLHYSGLTALQFYINDYVNNTHKIEVANELINTIQPVLDNVIDEHEKDYNSSEERIKEYIEDLKKIAPFLSEENKERKKELEDKINNIQVDNNKLDSLEQQVLNEFDGILGKLNKHKIELKSAKKLIEEANTTLENLAVSLSTTINSENEHIFKTVKLEIQEMLEASFKQMVTDAKLTDRNTRMLKNLIQINVNSSVDKVKYKKREEIGRRKESTSKWWNPFTWGTYKVVPIYDDKEYVNLQKIYELDFKPIQSEARNNIKEFKSSLKKGIDELKNEGRSKIYEIENNLNEKINQEKIVKKQIELSTSLKEQKEIELKKMKDYQIKIQQLINTNERL